MHLLINMDVPDLPEAIRFYCNAVGLTFNRIIDGDVAELAGASSMLYLLQKNSGTKVAADNGQRHYSRHWTPVHLDFVVEDIDAATERALRAGARQESGCVEWMGSRCITFSDPFGHGFCLIEVVGGTNSAEADIRQYEPDRPARSGGITGTHTGCSFCGKFSDEVQRLVAGPGVFICNECVEHAAADCRQREHPRPQGPADP